MCTSTPTTPEVPRVPGPLALASAWWLKRPKVPSSVRKPCLIRQGVVESPSVPEDVGEQAARALLREIYRGGCVDSSNQGLAALCMCLGPPDVSKCIVGPLTPYTIQMLRHLRDFFGVTFKVEGDCPGEGAPKVQLTCVGVGFSNLAKTTS
ncbi:hypothetical protein MTO96_003301 [Rhipicephalus appendiculatus]